jgi:hypothetical protein
MRLASYGMLGCLLVQSAHALPLTHLSVSKRNHGDSAIVGPEARGIIIIHTAAATAGKTASVSNTTGAGHFLTLVSNFTSTVPTVSRTALLLTTATSTPPSGLAPVVALAVDDDYNSKPSREGIIALETTTTTSPSTPSKDPSGKTAEATSSLGQDAEGWVKAHNAARALYGAAALVWDEGLSTKAMGNAKLCSHSHSYVSPLLKPSAVWISEDISYQPGRCVEIGR